MVYLANLLMPLLIIPNKTELCKVAIGFLPCGSQNAICCDLGGRNVNDAWINILRGKTIPSDIMKIHFKESGETIFGTTLLWGITGDIAAKAEKWRGFWKSAKYAIAGTSTFISSWKLKNYKWQVQLRNTINILEELKSESNEDSKFENIHDKSKLEDFQEEGKLEDSYEESKLESFDEENKLDDFHENAQIEEDIKEEWMSKCKNFSLVHKSTTSSMAQSCWAPFNYENFSFFGIVTHEARSSLRKKEMFMPPARFNDKKMYIGSLQQVGKFRLLRFLSKVTNGKILKCKKFSGIEVTEVKIKPIVESCFNIDGEIYPQDEVHVVLMPSQLNLIGKVFE